MNFRNKIPAAIFAAILLASGGDLAAQQKQ
ncbi:MAG: hypothetical protein JWN92_713, partial [Candidatus Acidoferrum typicum]|nr:hypothetical protein [Candidatus Acidoferrum typicum]